MTLPYSRSRIAGPTLSYCSLGRDEAYDREDLAVDTDERLRDCLLELAYDVADRMGLCGDLDRFGYRIKGMQIVDDGGKPKSDFGTNAFRGASSPFDLATLRAYC